MRFNQDALKSHACLPGDKEGKLVHKVPREGFKERWIKLRGNLLYYFKLNEFGTAKAFEPPVGVLVVEACSVREELPDNKYPFIFSIEFEGDSGPQKHYFACQSDVHCREWIRAIQDASHSLLKARLESLRSEFKRRKLKPSDDTSSFPPTAQTTTRHTIARMTPAVARPQVAVPKKNSSFFTDWESFE